MYDKDEKKFNEDVDKYIDTFYELASALLKSKYESKRITNEYDAEKFKREYEEYLREVHIQFAARNKTLTTLLEDYVNRSKKRKLANDVLKYISFGTFTFIIMGLTIFVGIAFVKVNLNCISVQSVAAIVSIAVTYIGSLITIYQIIFKYLFPADEEQNTIKMIQTVIENDINVEKITSAYMERRSENRSNDAK